MARRFASDISQYLSGPGIAADSTKFSCCGWALIDDATPIADSQLFCLIDGGDSCRFRILTSGLVQIRISAGIVSTLSSEKALSDNTWAFCAVAVDFDNNTFLVVVDDTSTDNTNNISSVRTWDTFQLSGSVNTLKGGSLAHWAFWDNIVLSVSEFSSIYNGGLGMDPRYIRPANLVAYWPLTDNDLDVVGSYDLTPYNDPTFVSGPSILTPALRGANKGAVQKHPQDKVYFIV